MEHVRGEAKFKEIQARVVAVRTLMHFVKLKHLSQDNGKSDKSDQLRNDTAIFGYHIFDRTLKSVLTGCSCADDNPKQAEENQMLLDLLLEEYIDKFHDVQLHTLRILVGRLKLLTQRNEAGGEDIFSENKEGILLSIYVDVLLRIQIPNSEAECHLYCSRKPTQRSVLTTTSSIFTR